MCCFPYNFSGDFLKTLEDPDLNVRRVALVTFNSAAHNKPSLIRDLLDTVLPHLYNETKVRKELIREVSKVILHFLSAYLSLLSISTHSFLFQQVEMGPFKHTVDDGLDIRKAAFECMYTLLDSCLDRLDIFEFLNHVEDGLKDHYDIKVRCLCLFIEYFRRLSYCDFYPCNLLLCIKWEKIGLLVMVLLSVMNYNNAKVIVMQ